MNIENINLGKVNMCKSCQVEMDVDVGKGVDDQGVGLCDIEGYGCNDKCVDCKCEGGGE